jgi:hypothetical protein
LSPQLHRASFAKIREPLAVPDLLALQTASFDWLLGNDAWRARVVERYGRAPEITRFDVLGVDAAPSFSPGP